MSDAMPILDEIPEPIPMLEGEAVAEIRHYRDKETKAPKCGALVDDDTPFARTWSDVTCEHCLAARKKKRGRPKKEPTAEVVTPQSSPEDNAILQMMLVQGINYGLLQIQRPPLPSPDDGGPGPTEALATSVIAVMDHYGLLKATGHPLMGLGLSSVMFYVALQQAPIIEDKTELLKAHGYVVS